MRPNTLKAASNLWTQPAWQTWWFNLSVMAAVRNVHCFIVSLYHSSSSLKRHSWKNLLASPSDSEGCLGSPPVSCLLFVFNLKETNSTSNFCVSACDKKNSGSPNDIDSRCPFVCELCGCGHDGMCVLVYLCCVCVENAADYVCVCLCRALAWLTWWCVVWGHYVLWSWHGPSEP